MKKCKQGYYYCYTDEKCKPIPKGLKMTARFSGGGKEPEETGIDVPTNGNNQNGNGNGNGGSNGGSNGGGVSEAWSAKYKKSIDCDNPKGFSQRAHCQGKKKVTEGKEGDHEVSMAKSQLKKSAENIAKLRKVLKKKTDKDNLPAWVQAKITDTEHNTDAAAGYMEEGKRDGKSAKSKGYSLRDWFKGGGWKQTGGKYDRKPCAKQPGQTTKPYCRDADDRAAMSKDERNKAAAKKRKEDPNPDRKGKAKMVTQNNSFEPEANVVEEEKKKKRDACYHKVKSRYSVWPSAYASGALVKCRKVGAANWGNSTKKESYELSNWRDDFKATEYEFIDLIKPEPLKGEQIDEGQKCWKGYEKKGTKKMFGKTYNNCVKKEETEIEEKKDPCWDTHKQVGMKKKGGKMVPNCVPKEEKQIGGGNLKKLAGKATKRVDADVDGDVDTKDMNSSETGEFVPSPCGKKKLKPKVRFEQSDWRSDLGEDWQKVNKSDKTDGMSQKAVNAYRRENPGSKLKTAVTGNPKKGSKDAKRRSSYCSRSEGQKDMHNIDCTKTPDKAICKARRRWKC